MACEAAGIGSWTGARNIVPTTEKGDKFGTSADADPEHPRLTTMQGTSMQSTKTQNPAMQNPATQDTLTQHNDASMAAPEEPSVIGTEEGGEAKEATTIVQEV